LLEYRVEGADSQDLQRAGSTRSLTPSMQNSTAVNNTPLSRPEMNELQESWNSVTSFIRESKRLHEGVLNALEEMDRMMQSEIDDMSLSQI